MAGKAKGTPESLLGLDAVELARRLGEGALSAGALAGACLQATADKESGVGAWAWLESDHVLAEASRRDAARKSGAPSGSLHGMPVGVKDIVDTARIPTENGTVLDKGRVPREDAFIVARLKQAGAIVMGKTVTTELAFMDPSHTRNPHDASRTPGGSSSGSAAAVAAGMVPLAVGTQTGGSVIRPAAFCGVTGFKPTFGAIPRTGILSQAPSLDTVGVFGRTVADAALLADALFGHDPADPASVPRPAPRLLATANSRPPVKPTFAFYRPPGWERTEESTRGALEELLAILGEQCFEIALPEAFAKADEQRRTIHFAELAKCYYAYERRGFDQLGNQLRETIERGKSILARDYIAALDWPRLLNAGLDRVFERCDAIITPAALGPAPALDTTGDPVFNGVWTLCGTPAISLPLFADEAGMPMGVQLIGPREGDARLLRTANWLVREVSGTNSEEA